MTSNTYAVKDKTVIVTGAGSGIGRSIARAFLEQGAKVVVTGRRPEPLAETIEGHDEFHALAIPNDISVRTQVQGLVEKVVETFGGIDIVVSNAAAYAGGELADLSDDDWAAMRDTNIDGFLYLAQASLPELEKSGGNLVAITSVSAFRGDWGQAGYNASKHAITGFVSSLALDYGAKGVRINAVAPAFTITPLTESMAESEEKLKPFVNRVALGRPGHPDDIPGAVMFLASDDAAYITGTTLRVDGGTASSTGQPHVE